MKRVVITGIGTVNPLGNNPETFFENLINGKSGIVPATKFDVDDLGIYLAGEINKDFAPESILDKKSIRRYDDFSVFGVYAAKQAFLDANLDKVEFDRYRFSSIISSGAGGIKTYVQEIEKATNLKTWGRLHPMTLVKSLPNMLAGGVAIELNAKGLSLCVVTACASGTHSIGEATHIIKRGDADIVVAGASDAPVFSFGTGSFGALKALSRSKDPSRGSIPFDKERNGFVIAEGAGAIILEDLDFALARGAKIYAEIIGYGATCDANHITAPSLEGPTKCMSQAIKKAGLQPQDITYINAHGTSTLINDANESAAIKQVFGEHAKHLKVSSIKSSIGHTLAAAGVIEAVSIVKMLQTGMVPGTINSNGDGEGCDLDYMINGSEKLNPKYILSNSFGFGGHNGTLIFKKWEGK